MILLILFQLILLLLNIHQDMGERSRVWCPRPTVQTLARPKVIIPADFVLSNPCPVRVDGSDLQKGDDHLSLAGRKRRGFLSLPTKRKEQRKGLMVSNNCSMRGSFLSYSNNSTTRVHPIKMRQRDHASGGRAQP